MIPEPGQTNLNFANFIILLGVVQGILLTVTGFTNRKKSGIIRGLLFLIITCIMTEFFLNRTGYMYRVIALVDFSEPLQFAIPPLIYLGVISLDRDAFPSRWQLHFIPFALYMLYFLPYYFAPTQFKLESYYFTHHLNNLKPFTDYNFYNEWGEVRRFQMQFFYLQTTVYLIFTFQKLYRYKSGQEGSGSISSYPISWWFTFSILISLLILIVIVVKIIFIKDLGDHIIAIFLTLILYLSTISEMIRPSSVNIPDSHDPSREVRSNGPASGIDEARKNEIYQKLVGLIEGEHLYRDNLISLQKLSKLTGEPAYVVSKVINEKSGFSFFDWIAFLRVEEAKRLLHDPTAGKYTIEQIAEEVGYNSKSAFNKAFRKFTEKTPSQFRSV